MKAMVFDFNTAAKQDVDLDSFSPPVINRSEAEQRFYDAMKDAGLFPDFTNDTDGKILRCPVDGDRGAEKSGWYIYFSNGIPAGAFGNWGTGVTESWSAKSEIAMTREESAEYNRRMEYVKREREKVAIALQAEAAEVAKKNWDKATPVEEFPYLKKKGVVSHGLRVFNGELIIPIVNRHAKVTHHVHLKVTHPWGVI